VHLAKGQWAHAKSNAGYTALRKSGKLKDIWDEWTAMKHLPAPQ
jgi:hypothetical protein